MSDKSQIFDFAVVGAGIVGSAIARRLSSFAASVVLLEAKADVGDGTSKANTAILHTGFDAKPGTLESRMVHEGYFKLQEYAEQTGIPLQRTGAVLVAWEQDQWEALPALQEKAQANGYHKTEIISAEDVYAQLPHLGEGVLGGLTVPDESIICTWTTNLALATDAVNRGATLMVNSPVRNIVHMPDHTVLDTPQGKVAARWVINAAGLGSDTVDGLFGYDRFHVVPRRGELLVYDKQARPLVDKIVLPVPTSRGKGVLVSPTIYGNVMLGPTAEDLDDKTKTGTSEEGFEFLLEKGQRLLPELLGEEVTATYAGLRAATEHSDYVVDLDAEQRYVVAGGIRSTGLTSGIALADHIVSLLDDAGVRFAERDDLPEPPRMPNIGENALRPYQDAERIAEDPAYGEVVCFCERVTAGEIRDTFDSPIPPANLSGLRRRTRAMNGRCQGFFCGAHVRSLIESKLGAKQ